MVSDVPVSQNRGIAPNFIKTPAWFFRSAGWSILAYLCLVSQCNAQQLTPSCDMQSIVLPSCRWSACALCSDPLLSVVWTRSISTQWKISLKERKQAQQLHCRVQSCCVLQQVKWGLEGAKWFEGSELVCKMVPFAPRHWVTENCRSNKLPKVGMPKVFSFLMFLMTNTPNCFLHSCFSVPPG